MSARAEAVEEIIRQRQRIIGIFGMHAQTARHQKPVEIRADHQTDGNPSLIQTAQINRAGQTHQKPARHIGRARRHRRNKRAQASAAQNIIIEIARGEIRGQTNQENSNQIDCKSDIHGIHLFVLVQSSKIQAPKL